MVDPAAGSVTTPEGKCRHDAGSLWIANSAAASPSTGSSSHSRSVVRWRQSLTPSHSSRPRSISAFLASRCARRISASR